MVKQRTLHDHVCSQCGNVRKSPTKPTADYAVRVCRACHLENNRYYLSKMFNRTFLPREERPK